MTRSKNNVGVSVSMFKYNPEDRSAWIEYTDSKGSDKTVRRQKDMVPYFQKVQQAGRSLLIRGAFTADEIRLLMDALAPQGLFLNIMVKRMEEIEALRPIVGM